MKKNLARAGFVILLAITAYLAVSILSIKSEHGVDQSSGIYWQPENSIDVVMMGTSHVHCGINTGLLWENFGIASYDYSAAEQPLWMTYYYLKELYKYQSPEVIVLDVYAPARFKEDYQYKWISENIYGMRFSLNKLQMLLVSVEFQNLHKYFPSFAAYHSRYDDLEAEDFETFFWNSQEKEAFKGYTPYFSIWPQERPEISVNEKNGLTLKSEKYLKKIIAYTKEKESKLVLIVSPYIVTTEDKTTYNQIADIAEEEKIAFIDFNKYYDEMELDFDADFNDPSHLNYWGSCKFTDFLGLYLSQNVRVPDRRGEEGYRSWEENVQLIYDEVRNHENSTAEE